MNRFRMCNVTNLVWFNLPNPRDLPLWIHTINLRGLSPPKPPLWFRVCKKCLQYDTLASRQQLIFIIHKIFSLSMSQFSVKRMLLLSYFCLSDCYTGDPRLNNSIYQNILCTTWRQWCFVVFWGQICSPAFTVHPVASPVKAKIWQIHLEMVWFRT